MRNLFNTFGIILTILIFSSCKKDPVPPVLTTASVTSITSTSAVSGGNVTDDGGAAVTSRGVCWSTSDNPVITDNKTFDSEVSGPFTSILSPLIPNTGYFVRAFATNSLGTSYGSAVSFKTAGEKPALSTSNLSEILITSANLNEIVNANSSATTVTFEYGLTTSYGYTITAAQSPLTGSTPVNISANLTGLTPQTTYHFRVIATNELGTTISNDLKFTTYAVADVDNNLYHSVTIGTQTWMSENLKTTKYNDGTSIPFITDKSAWAGTATGAYCDHNNTPLTSTTYGRLYNWYAGDNNVATKIASNGGKNVCPTGWHVPGNAEWIALVTYLGGGNVAGGKLKETGTLHWTGFNMGATNETGFTALPGGSRFGAGGFTSLGVYGNFWTTSATTSYNSSGIWYMYTGGAQIDRKTMDKRFGNSLRCIRDF